MKKVEEFYPATVITIKRWSMDGTPEEKISCCHLYTLRRTAHEKERKAYSGLSH